MNAILEKGSAFVFHLNEDFVGVSFSSLYVDVTFKTRHNVYEDGEILIRTPQ